SSLLRFAHKTSKNRRLGDFYLTNCVRMPDNSGFYGFFAKKGRKNLQAQQAASSRGHFVSDCTCGFFAQCAFGTPSYKKSRSIGMLYSSSIRSL
ncbi:MAG: hypothetical protein LBQ88_15360, partial [Treponema sp.]|nr:hypothetical protein [Treponema sp.]